MIFETERLIVREYDAAQDAEAAFAIYGDPVVTRYLGDGSPVPDLATQLARLVDRVAQYRAAQDGSFFGAICLRSGELLGSLILKPLPDGEGVPTEDWEIGWHLGRHAWGYGYASEAAAAGLRYGFETVGLEEIFAVVREENLPSVRVTERIGMLPLGTTDSYYGRELLLFRAG